MYNKDYYVPEDEKITEMNPDVLRAASYYYYLNSCLLTPEEERKRCLVNDRISYLDSEAHT